MKLNDKLYNFLKWTSMIFLRAFGEFYNAMSEIWGLPYGNQILQTCSRLALFIGILIGISTYTYHKENVGEGTEIIEPIQDEKELDVVEIEEDSNDKDV